jgi:DNA end-binding protein Ku
MRPAWNGTISFGLVNIPVALYSATRSERISFNLLHKKDMGRVGNIRKCKLCGKELSPDDITKGYEVDKDEYIEITDEDLEKAEAEVEAARTIQIMDFVEQDEIDPKFFDSPYYVVPGKNADHVYVLLREALKKTKKVGIAKLVFRDREHLAAIKPDGRAIMLDTMHFADEISEGDDLKIPSESAKVGAKEIAMAEQLVEMMSDEFDPEKYKDSYREALLAVINKKSTGVKTKGSTKRQKETATTNVVDIMSRLKASLEKSPAKRKTTAKASPARRRKTRAA